MDGFRLVIEPEEGEPEAAGVFVDVRLDGRAYRCLLDTGAARSAVVADEYTATFEVSGEHQSSGVFARSQTDVITIPRLELDPIAWQDVRLSRVDASTPGVRSLIGMDLLKDYRLHFLFSEHRVRVNQPVPAGVPLHDLLLGKKFHPYVEVDFGGQAFPAVWDTGASLTIADLGLIDQFPANFRLAGQSHGTDATGAGTDTPVYVMTGAVTGGHAFAPHRVAGVDLSHVNATTETPFRLILGYSTLRQVDWVFDFPQKKWGIAGPFPP